MLLIQPPTSWCAEALARNKAWYHCVAGSDAEAKPQAKDCNIGSYTLLFAKKEMRRSAQIALLYYDLKRLLLPNGNAKAAMRERNGWMALLVRTAAISHHPSVPGLGGHKGGAFLIAD
jgi:hypothetical protein